MKKSSPLKQILRLTLAIMLIAVTAISCATPDNPTGTGSPDDTNSPIDSPNASNPNDDSEGGVVIQPLDGIAKSSLARNMAPNVAEVDFSKLVSGNSAFAFDLYQQLQYDEGNLFFSPYSISLALAMTYAGAKNETEHQMAKTLHFTFPQESLHPALNALDIDLMSRGEGAVGKDGEPFQLNIANSIWGQQDFEFLETFLDVLAQNYGAGLRLLDFIGAPEESRTTINDWVSSQTEEKIQDLIPEGAIGNMTRLVLANAIYFDAAWQHKFNEDFTQDRTFNLIDGSQITVPMMSQTESFRYYEGEGCRAVELPYDGGEVSMLLLLPESGRFDEFEGALDASKMGAIMQNLQPSRVLLKMPKFEYESSFKLSEQLGNMGMPIAFSAAADFSGMHLPSELNISEVLHKAFVSVDESGTEAAAATAVLMELTSMPQPPVPVTLDRPFIYLIQDVETGTILFLGRVMNPSAT